MPKNRPFENGVVCLECGTANNPERARGLCTKCYGKLYREAQRNQGVETVAQDTLEEENSPAPAVGVNEERRPGSEPNPSDSPGVDLQEQGEGIGGKFRKFVLGDKTPKDNFAGFKTQPMKTKEVKPSGNSKRISAADSLGDLWSGIGGLLTRLPNHAPSGKLLQFQSQAAGEILDEALKGTFVDSMILQKAVKARGRFDVLGAVLMPPAIVFAIETNPERAPYLIPLLESSLRNALPHMVKPIQKARKREADQAEAIRELFPDAPEGSDPIKELIAEIFGGWQAPVNEEEEEVLQDEQF